MRIADGSLDTSFNANAPEAHLAYARKWAENAGQTLDNITVRVYPSIAITDDPEQLFPQLKMQRAFQLTAMGSLTISFYDDVYARSSFESCGEHGGGVDIIGCAI